MAKKAVVDTVNVSVTKEARRSVRTWVQLNVEWGRKNHVQYQPKQINLLEQHHRYDVEV